MLDQIKTVLNKRCSLDTRKAVIIGVSGGPDSLCLFNILWEMQFSLVIVHFNHGLREEADKEAFLVKQMAEEKGIPFMLGQRDVRKYAQSSSLSLEEAARNLRYDFLFEQAREFKAQAVAVGHTADDQVETVLMHLLRGAGISGLRGMLYRSLPNAWSEEIPLVRPLLGTWRYEILEYLRERNINPMQDESNQDTTYYRNRLRHELIPFLETYNPQIKQVIWRSADTLGADETFLQTTLDTYWDRAIAMEGEGFVGFTKASFLEYPVGLQRNLIRRGISKMQPGLRDVNYEAVERVLDSLESSQMNKKIDLSAGIYWLVEEEVCWLKMGESLLSLPDVPQLADDEQYRLQGHETLILGGGWQLHAAVLENIEGINDKVKANPDSYQAWLSLDTLPMPLFIRGRKPGDRIKPYGMDGRTVKVSDLMVNLKIAARARARWPLVCSDGDIIWIPGYRIGYEYRVKEKTRKVLHLTMRKQ